MRDHFEIRDHDAAGRIGRLEVPRAGVTVETPALLPVVNPNVLTVDPERLRSEFGAEMLITNSYIIRSTDRIRDRVLAEGLHDFLEFDGAIMTDSGSFQLAEYGDIDVTTAEILEFQRRIGSDVATPVDVPTPPDVERDRAERELETTQQALADAEAAETGEMLVNAPVQGSTYPDLREAAGRQAAGTDACGDPRGRAGDRERDAAHRRRREGVRDGPGGLGRAPRRVRGVQAGAVRRPAREGVGRRRRRWRPASRRAQFAPRTTWPYFSSATNTAPPKALPIVASTRNPA